MEKLFHRFIDPVSTNAHSKARDYPVKIFGFLIAFVGQHDRRCEVIKIRKFRQFLWISFDLILYARVRVPTDCVETCAEEGNEAQRRADCDVSRPNESWKSKHVEHEVSVSRDFTNLMLSTLIH